jgi:cytochrome b561
MNDTTATSSHYDARSISLHWLTAALVIGLWALGQCIDFFPKGDARVIARSVHIAFGAALGLVLLYRIWWRASAGVHLPPAGSGRLDALAGLTHKALYLLLIATVVLGVANTWVRGDNLFNWFTIPAFDPGNRDLRESVEEWHGLAANILLAVAALHAVAGIVHHVVFKDDVLRRMMPLRSER